MVVRRGKKKSRTVTVNWEDEVEGGSFHIPAGDYKVRVEEVEQDVSGNDNDMLVWKMRGLAGKAKGKLFKHYTALTPEALFKLRETLEGLGQEVPEETADIDLDDLIDLEGVAIVEDNVYEGRTSSRITGFRAEGEEGEEEEEEKPRRGRPKKPAARKGKTKKWSSDEIKEMSEDDLEGVIEKSGVEVDLSEFKVIGKKRNAVIAALEEEDLLDDDE